MNVIEIRLHYTPLSLPLEIAFNSENVYFLFISICQLIFPLKINVYQLLRQIKEVTRVNVFVPASESGRRWIEMQL